VPRRFDAIICDIDGCLAPESAAPMDTAALAEIAEHNRLAQERGDRPVMTLCSGRPQPFVEAMCRLLGNHTLPVVAENGVWLYHPADNRYDRDPGITAADLRTVQAAREWVEDELGPRGVVMQPGKAASISLYHPDTAFLRSLEAPVREEFARRGWGLRVSMTWLYINCDLAHVSKATGIDRLLAHTGLERHRLAGIGDTPSDLAIAQRVAFFACPANAAPEIKQRADMVSALEEARGVVDIIRRLPA
jgi:hydroxymethylpyrimidine pyrophosphatase-like HAD family hydrolase